MVNAVKMSVHVDCVFESCRKPHVLIFLFSLEVGQHSEAMVRTEGLDNTKCFSNI